MSIQHAQAIKSCKEFFSIRELMPPDLVGKFSEEILWKQIDTDLLLALAWVRAEYNDQIVINNWSFKAPGTLKYCGFRPSSCSEGAVLSGHRLGKSADLHAKDLIRLLEICMRCPYITEVEDERDTPTWVHISVRAHAGDGVRVVRA